MPDKITMDADDADDPVPVCECCEQPVEMVNRDCICPVCEAKTDAITAITDAVEKAAKLGFSLADVVDIAGSAWKTVTAAPRHVVHRCECGNALPDETWEHCPQCLAGTGGQG